MATANDYFITEIELANLAGVSTSSYSNKFATKTLATTSPFATRVKLLNNATSYKNEQFIEKKNISKVSQSAFDYGMVSISTMADMLQNLGLKEETSTIRILVQTTMDNDVNYPGNVFSSSTPDWYQGAKAIEFYPDGGTYSFNADSRDNYDSLWFNGFSIKITPWPSWTYSGPYFALVTFYNGTTSDATLVGYCCTECYYTGYTNSFTLSNIDYSHLKPITKVIKTSDYSKVPYRIYKDTDGKYKCKFRDETLGQSLDYFYS